MDSSQIQASGTNPSVSSLCQKTLWQAEFGWVLASHTHPYVITCVCLVGCLSNTILSFCCQMLVSDLIFLGSFAFSVLPVGHQYLI